MFNGALLTVDTGRWCGVGTDWGNKTSALMLEVFFTISGLEEVLAIIMFGVAKFGETVSLTLRPANKDDAVGIEKRS